MYTVSHVDHVMIEGITWDSCGDPDITTDAAGVTFNGTRNISLVNCTFQHSQLFAVNFLNVFENINIDHCKFLSNRVMLYNVSNIHCSHGVLHIANHNSSKSVYLNISDSYFYDNECDKICEVFFKTHILNVEGTAVWQVIITKTTFSSNKGSVIGFVIDGDVSIQLRELNFNNNYGGNLLGFTPLSNNNIYTPVLLDTNRLSNKTEILISNSTFTNNCNGSIILLPLPNTVVITLVDTEFSHNVVKDGTLVITFLEIFDYEIKINLTRVNVMSNRCLGSYGGAVNIQLSASYTNDQSIIFEDCEFFNNTNNSYHGAAFYISSNDDSYTSFRILNSKIHHNYGDKSVIYLHNMHLILNSSNFTDNTASSIFLVSSDLECADGVIFANNIADNGGAIYIDQESRISFESDTTNVQFINNSATEYGGAICFHFLYDCPTYLFPFYSFYNGVVSFVNNTAGISGNSLYFYIPEHCEVETNISNDNSILYIPCQFNYSQSVNGKMMHIPCDLDYTLLNGTGAPIVTSPHELRLFFPFNDDYNISSTSDHNIYFIRNNVLGYPVKFTGNVFDYFGKPAEPTQFDVHCVNCSSSIVLPKALVLVDNITSLSITFTGSNIENSININVTLTSTIHSIKQITTTLIVELIPCIDHPGYTYSTAHKACACYHHNVDCHDSYNEIKRGYWFGSVSNTATTAPCHHYCKFTGRTETRQGYFELPNTIDGQCNDHRVGRACGECSSGYTLSYDSTDCISVDQCGAGWTVLVITLTCLYWIAIVAGVFGLMYFKFQISLGYLYGLIYYYSIINILLDSNPNLSDGVFQFASVLSSFAQLTPQFLGELCFVKGLSGIDQLFIHYSHAVGVSLLLLLIVVAARCSARVSLFVSRCIIRVICLLILLSYTSIVSTSLQLLQPLRFTDIKEWYTYSSPNIQYFHGRHAVYGVVAIICELIVGIGLPLLLLLQPFLNRKINFIRI